MTRGPCKRLRAKWLGRALCMAAALSAPTAFAYDWLQFGGDEAHSGSITVERTLGPRNVGTLVRKYTATLPGIADSPPVAARGVMLAGVPTDLLFVTTTDGGLVALNAATGAQVWAKFHGPGTCKINNVGGPCYTTSSPVIDVDRQFVYSYGLDGYVHKHFIADGMEQVWDGWPQLSSLKPYHEKGSSALSLATSGTATFLYAVHGGYPGDNGDYQGHLTAINLTDDTQKVFNANCSDVRAHFGDIPDTPNPLPPNPYCSSPRSAIWSRPGVIHDAATGRIFVTTGNGTYTGNANALNWSESILALNVDGTSVAVKPLDAYTPTNFASLDASDADLGSTSVAIIPMPPGSAFAHVGVQAGKDSKLRLVNLDNLSNGTLPAVAGRLGGQIGSIINVPQGGGVFTQPAVWINPVDDARWVFVATSGGVSGLQLKLDVSGNPSLESKWTFGQGGTSPVVVNGVLYYVGSNTLHALDPASGASLWTSNPGEVGSIHWQSPIVMNGWVYVTDQSAHLVAYAPASRKASAGFDVDADGKADIAWQNTLGQTALWKMDGASATAASLIMVDPNWRLTAYADFNGDGKSDFVWKNQNSGATAFWQMNGMGPSAVTVMMPDGSWSVAGFPDVNGDGIQDLLWRNTTTGATALWIMNGLKATAASLVMSDSNWTEVFSGDFNGDGRDDLVWYNATTGGTAIWLMDGLHAHAAGLVMTAPWVPLAIGDFDGDGKTDLLWRNSVTGVTNITLMDGLVATQTATLNTDAAWSVIQVGDINGDGRSDIVWQQTPATSTFPVQEWFMDGVQAIRTLGLSAFSSNTATVAALVDADGDQRADFVWRDAVTQGNTSLMLEDKATWRSLQANTTWIFVTPAH